MPQIPSAVSVTVFSQLLPMCGLKLIHQGKVRDTYALPGQSDLLLMVAEDRISIFDFVLSSLISHKGEILTALTVFWLTGHLNTWKHHLVAYGRDIDSYLPAKLRGNTDLQRRALVVKKMSMIPVECICRGYLTGSGWSAYKKNGEVCGHKLPLGLHDGSQLIVEPGVFHPIFTPTTKSHEGHDEHISAHEVRERYGVALEDATRNIYMVAHNYAKSCDVIIADTKLEFGFIFDSKNNSQDLVIGDEVLTPDSSRFWDEKEWEEACSAGKSPQSYDKEVVRSEGKKIETPFEDPNTHIKIIGINNLEPKIQSHVLFVHSLSFPEICLKRASVRYHEIFARLVGENLISFQESAMNIRS